MSLKSYFKNLLVGTLITLDEEGNVIISIPRNSVPDAGNPQCVARDLELDVLPVIFLHISQIIGLLMCQETIA